MLLQLTGIDALLRTPWNDRLPRPSRETFEEIALHRAGNRKLLTEVLARELTLKCVESPPICLAKSQITAGGLKKTIFGYVYKFLCVSPPVTKTS